ncbi:MAG: ribosomal-protein-alanine N-acetyltransferase [Chloroflexi bacterium RBG_13_50_21]|nr:MAG: ribosomal-protein-alanine N-acetyltransferase [Chloroflexi bacterium RBG_13_50_21]
MILDDIPRVHEIDVLSFSLPWPEKSYLFELTENPTTLALVAEITTPDSRPVVIGMAVVWIVIDEAHIATIAIHPEYRGHGFGKKLLTETLRQSIQRGVILATLEVRENNKTAQQMYKNFGFNNIGRRLRYYKDNDEDAILMTLDDLGLQYLAWLDKLGV